MFLLPRRLRSRWILRRQRIAPELWQGVVGELPLLRGLDAEDSARLRDLALLFLHEKAVDPVQGVELSDRERLLIAALACLPVLNLGLDYYSGWYSVVVYPGGFIARHEYVEEDGTVHASHSPLVGEAWEQGPVIVSWDDVRSAVALDGFNVLIHELAHKLDMLTEGANGLPPLHAGMSVKAWSEAFTEAFESLCDAVDAGEETALDPYAADSPGEFFAVVSEAFFEIPGLLQATYPKVYQQLRQFYRQDPLSRLGAR